MPVVGAPLAGGPSTPALAAAVSEAGGLGFLAAGYKTAAASGGAARAPGADVAADRPQPLLSDPRRRRRGGARGLRRADAGRGQRYGVAAGEPRWTDDDWTAKLDVAARERPDVVSFTFGCPEREIVEWLRDCGCRVWCTVTSRRRGGAGDVPASTRSSSRAPRPAATRARSRITTRSRVPLLALLGRDRSCNRAAANRRRRDRRRTRHRGRARSRRGRRADRLRAAARDRSRHVDAAPAALERDAETRLTRAFTGRRARGIVNRFLLDHDAFAPHGVSRDPLPDGADPRRGARAR